MTIEVTDEDIDFGLMCDAECCPVARALRRAGFRDVAVYEDYTKIGALRIAHSHAVAVFVARFDYERSVQPFSFDFPEAPQC